MTTCAKIVAYRDRHALAYAVLVALACAMAYFALLHWFRQWPAFNDKTLLCPAAGAGPVLGLFFGIPGIVGCSAASVISDVLCGYDAAQVVMRGVTSTLYLGSLCPLWYWIHRKAAVPYATFSSSHKVASYLVCSVVLALETVVLGVVGDSLAGGVRPSLAYSIVALNNWTFLIYLGMPLLIALNRSQLPPADPWFKGDRALEGAAERKLTRMNLTQRMAVAGVIVTFAVVVVLNVLYFVPYPFYQGFYSMAPDLLSGAYALSAVFTVIIFVPMVAGLYFLETHYTRPVEAVTRSLGTFIDRLRAGKHAETHIDLAGATPRNEVEDLVEAAETLQASLIDHITRLSAATAERERSDAQLEIARNIQMSVVPHAFDRFRALGVDVYGFMRTAQEVGGDFYDVFEAGGGRVGVVIGDVSGKGVPAALFMMRALNELRYQAISCTDLGAALTRASETLFQDGGVTDVFVTAFVCIVDPRTRRLCYANAGHCRPLVRRGAEESWLDCDPERIISPYRHHVYTQHELDLAPDDGLLLYTDGVTEAANAERELLGEEGLADAARAVVARGTGDDGVSRMDVRCALRHIEERVDAFAAGTPQTDDLTMVGFMLL